MTNQDAALDAAEVAITPNRTGCSDLFNVASGAATDQAASLPDERSDVAATSAVVSAPAAGEELMTNHYPASATAYNDTHRGRSKMESAIDVSRPVRDRHAG